MKNTLKPRVPTLNKVPKAFLEEQKENGLAGLVEPTAEERGNVEEWAAMVWEMLESTMQKFPYPVAGLYLYDHRQCSGDFGISEAICSNQVHTETGRNGLSLGLTLSRSGVAGNIWLSFCCMKSLTQPRRQLDTMTIFIST